MKLTRINPDHSWLLETPGLRLVVDPWLLGPEIDGFGWFHTQHLPQAAWPIAALGPLDAIVITQPFPTTATRKPCAPCPPPSPSWRFPLRTDASSAFFPKAETWFLWTELFAPILRSRS